MGSVRRSNPGSRHLHSHGSELFRSVLLILLAAAAIALLGGCGSQCWHAVPSGTKQILHGVTFADARHGWSVGDSGTIIATNDGGAHWSAERSGTRQDLYAVDFADAHHGWAVGSGDTILASSDGGATWHPQDSNIGANFTAVEFLNARCGWIGTDDGRVFLSVDGGRHWRSGSFATWGSNLLLASLAFTTPRVGWALVWQVDSPSSTLLESSDGGIHWTAKRTFPFLCKSVYFSDARYGWLTGDKGVYSTDDGGAHWVYHASPLHVDNFAIAFSGTEDGWLVGGEGGIALTGDGGKTWAAHDMGSSTDLNDVASLPGGSAIAVGDGGAILALSR
jgi:photosystem II stability/assembly factor-like uncharacterized protein